MRKKNNRNITSPLHCQDLPSIVHNPSERWSPDQEEQTPEPSTSNWKYECNTQEQREAMNDLRDENDVGDQYKICCHSEIHKESAINHGELINLLQRKRISAKDFQRLLESGIITDTSNYICKCCLDIALC